VTFEDIKALLRPYKISEEIRGPQQQRVNALKLGGNADDKVQTLLSGVETKSGVLLTHVSMMIAITGLMLSVRDSGGAYDMVLGVELVLYLLLALFCIRCQYQVDLKDFETLPTNGEGGKVPDRKHLYYQTLLGELYYRERIFRFVLKALYLLTFALALTVAFGLFANDLTLSTDGETK